MNFKTTDIIIDNIVVAKIFRYKKNKIKGVKFLTNNNLNLQVGVMSHPKNYLIKPHFHINKKRLIKNMSELLILFSGKLEVYFYNKKLKKCKSAILNPKDMILLISGGHGFKVLKPLQMIEIKQGPFVGTKDKVRF